MDFVNPQLAIFVASVCGAVFKMSPKISAERKMFCSVLLGGAIGVLALSDFQTTESVLSALRIGLLSGLEATGAVATAGYLMGKSSTKEPVKPAGDELPV